MTARRVSIDLAPARVARGTVRVPGSKSVSIRALLLAAQAEGRTTLRGVLRSDDTDVMTTALSSLGVPVVARDDGTTLVVDGSATFPKREAEVFVGNSGLSIRTLTAALAFAGGRYRLAGVPRMHERPIGDLVDALSAIGARVAYGATPGYPPLVIEPGHAIDVDPSATERVVRVRAHASSQFLTGVLQAGPALARDRDLVVEVDGALISRPYVDLTIAMMERFGVIVREGSANRFRIAKGARYQSPGTFDVEGDASSASYLLAAGLLGGGPVRVEGLGTGSSQGDARFVDVLIAMGADVSQGDDATEVRSPRIRVDDPTGFRLRPIDADFNDMPDVAMTVAVLALFADGPSTLRNIASWRVKETDRLAAMATELRKFGATVEEGDDWLRVDPATMPARDANAAPVEVATYDDHRIAMCFSLASFLGGPVRIDDPDCVAKTFPDYFERFAELVAGTEEPDPISLIS